MVIGRLIVVLIFVFCSSLIFACDSTVGYLHINPDGSPGGFVSSFAKVGSNVVVATTAKICGRAWVDDNSQILDNAKVTENAWIKSFVVLRENVMVSGNAVVAGLSEYHPVDMDGDVKVYGNARVRGSYNISGSVQIYGNIELKGAGQISGVSALCEDVVLADVSLTNSNYYCASDKISSGALKLNEKHYGKSVNLLMPVLLKLSGAVSLRSELVEVYANTQRVDNEYLAVQRDQVRILPNPHFKEGSNVIDVRAVDQDGKLVRNQVRDFLGGSYSHQIAMSGALTSEAKVRAWLRYAGEEVEIPARLEGSEIRLDSIPDLADVSLDIFVTDQSGYQYLSVSALNELPQGLSLLPWPAYQQNNLDFSSGLMGWQVNNSELIQLSSVSGNPQVTLALQGEELVLEHVFRLEDEWQSIMTPISFLKESILTELPNIDMHVLVMNSRTGEFKRAVFNPSKDEHLLRGSLDGLQARDKVINGSLPHGEADDLLLRFYIPGQIVKKDWATSFTVGRTGLSASSSVLVLKNLSLYHDSSIASGGALDLLSPRGCAPLSEYEKNVLSKLVPSFVHGESFFSAGMSPDYIDNYQNRVWGEFEFFVEKNTELTGIGIEVWQDGVLRAAVPGSPCLLASVQREQSGNYTRYKFQSDFNDPFSYLFSIPSGELGLVSTTPGAVVELVVYALAGEKVFHLHSETREVLASLNFNGSGYRYGNRDDYRSQAPGTVKTGGDSWGLPVVVSRLQDMTSLNEHLRVDDLSKMNGGVFPDHKEHQAGLDADIHLASGGQVTTSQFLTNQLLPFLRGMGSKISNFDFLLIDKNKTVLQYLNNRCVSDRYIAFNHSQSSEAALGKKGLSVMKFIGSGHGGHMHMEFPNGLRGKTSPVLPTINKPQPPGGVPSVHDFTFEYKDGSLKVGRRADVSYLSSFNVLWRAQDTEEYNGGEVIFGDDLSSQSEIKRKKKWWEKPVKKISPLDKPYLEVVVADFQNVDPNGSVYGGCVATKFQIREEDLCSGANQSKPFYYHKNPDGSIGGVVVVGSTVDEQSTLVREARVCSTGVAITASEILASAEIQSSNGDLEKNETKLEITGLMVTDPSSGKGKDSDEPFLYMAVDGKLQNVTITTPTDISGDIEMVNVTMDAPAASDKKMIFNNHFTDEKMIITDTDFMQGFSNVDGIVTISGSSISGPVKIDACKSGERDLCGDGEVVLNNVTIDSTGASKRNEELFISVESAEKIQMNNTEITGRPTFTEGFFINEATIEGDGNYVGSKHGALDGNGNQFLSGLIDGTFKGDNDFNGRYYLKTNMENSKVSNLEEVRPNGHFQLIILEEGMATKSLVGAEFTGNIHIRGEVPEDIKMTSGNGLASNGDYCNTFIEPGSSISGSGITVNGPLALWKNSSITYTEGDTHLLGISAYGTGCHTNVDYGSTLTDVELSGSSNFQDTTMNKKKVSGTNNRIFDSNLTEVTIGGTSCVIGRNWSNKSVSNFQCNDDDPLVSKRTPKTEAGMLKQKEAMNRYSAEVYQFMNSR